MFEIGRLRQWLQRCATPVRRLVGRANRTHLALLGVGLIILGLSQGDIRRSMVSDAAAFTRTRSLDLPPLDERTTFPAPVTAARWQSVPVSAGQSLDSIFRAQGFSIGLLQNILGLDADTRKLRSIRPGDRFEFQRQPDGSLAKMRYAIDEQHYLVVDNTAAGLSAHTELREIAPEVETAQGVIDSSLFSAGKAAGLSDSMVMKLANIFGWDIDFVLDIRSGDRFYLVYEKLYRDGEFLRDGEILAATFINQGEKFQAVRFEQDGAGQYYSPDGRPMRKAFLRAPLNFSYISSNFNPRRFHPILKRIKPHNGIDYRAPTGTPVYAAGDGRVVRAGYDKYNGNHVFIQHPNGIETKYLHFSKRAVSNGDRVHQGQVIGYVGMTGLAEAPHLHYEFLVNGVHRNPRTVPLPAADPITGQQLADFRVQSAPLLNQLSLLESAALYANRE